MDVQVSQDISPVTKHATGSRDGAGGLGGKGGEAGNVVAVYYRQDRKDDDRENRKDDDRTRPARNSSSIDIDIDIDININNDTDTDDQTDPKLLKPLLLTDRLRLSSQSRSNRFEPTHPLSWFG